MAAPIPASMHTVPTAPNVSTVPSAHTGTVSDDYESSYYRTHLGCDEEYGWDSPHWRTWFSTVADRIVAITNPSSVLDVGCATGVLVQALRAAGIRCDGIDISEHAIGKADPAVKPYLRVASAETVSGQWDLVTCIEVLEHMAVDACERAIDAMCAASDRVLVSSSPTDFTEPTHVNVRQPAEWAASFAERGFFRRTDVDLSFLTPWAVLYERAALSVRDVVHRYEAYAYPMRVEIVEKRAALLQAHRSLIEISEQPTESPQPNPLDAEVTRLQAEVAALQAEVARLHADSADADSALAAERARVLDLRHRLLTSRDYAMGAAAEADQWRARAAGAEARSAANDASLAITRAELHDAQRRAAEVAAQLDEVLTSETWRYAVRISRPMARLVRRRGERG